MGGITGEPSTGSVSFDPVGHSYQVGDRVRLHLLHHPAAMNFYCDLAQLQLRRDLLVGKARGHHFHDLALARREFFKARLQGCVAGMLVQPRSICLQPAMDGAEQFLFLKRLGEEIFRTILNFPPVHYPNHSLVHREPNRQTKKPARWDTRWVLNRAGLLLDDPHGCAGLPFDQSTDFVALIIRCSETDSKQSR